MTDVTIMSRTGVLRELQFGHQMTFTRTPVTSEYAVVKAHLFEVAGLFRKKL